MEYKDYYKTLGVARDATPDDIKRAYRKLARKYHPDVSKEPDAEARFKDVAEAYKALKDPELRAAYDAVGAGHQGGQPFEPPPGWDSGFEFSGGGQQGSDEFSDFFASLFGSRGGGAPRAARRRAPSPGGDHHAKVLIDLEDVYRGARRSIHLRVPAQDAQGRPVLRERQLEVQIPKGVRPGQHLRLAGQGGAGEGDAAAGDLYLEIELRPHRLYRVDGGDVIFDLPVSPWEAALGATVTAPTPEGPVQLTIPAGSSAGRKLRLKGRGLPGTPAGDLYALLGIALPAAGDAASQFAYAAFGQAFPNYQPRAGLELP